VLAADVHAVVDVPELGALVARVPLAKIVAEGEYALFGAGLLLIPPGASDGCVELVRGDGLEELRRLYDVMG
jgi:hypothetical protein